MVEPAFFVSLLTASTRELAESSRDASEVCEVSAAGSGNGTVADTHLFFSPFFSLSFLASTRCSLAGNSSAQSAESRRSTAAYEAAEAETRQRMLDAPQIDLKLRPRSSTRQQVLPVQLTSPGILPDPNCPDTIICPILLTNPGVPVISVYTELFVSNGALTSDTETYAPAPFCDTYITIPGESNILFTGTWTNTSIVGAWSEEFNLQSDESPPPLVIQNIAIRGNGDQVIMLDHGKQFL